MPPKVGKLQSPQMGKRNRVKSKEKKRHRINFKKWLETPADWEKFNAWAKINAQPRKIPEPEPIVRRVKPLKLMKKRIQVLSQPGKKYDSGAACRLDLSVSKAALNAKPSKRIKELAKFILKEEPKCREFPVKIRKAALRYKPSERIIEISKPFIRVSEECKSLEVSLRALKHKTTARERIMALAKKIIECPDSLTDEERNQLMTSTGIMKSAMTYKFTPWMSLLSLPSYKFLKDRKDKNAIAWKKKIIEESELRGKTALEEKLKKKQEEEVKRKRMMEKLEQKEKTEPQEGTSENVSAEQVEENAETGQVELGDGEISEGQDENKYQEKKARRRRKREIKAQEKSEETYEDNEKAKRRKAERNAWRFAPSPCKDIRIKKSALKGEVPPRVDELSKPNIRVDRACRKNPFGVRKSALAASTSARINEIAKPTHPRDPVERPPPREKDEYGRPIFSMPAYGKKLPKVQYVSPDCKTEGETGEKPKEEPEERPKEKPKEKRHSDQIAYMPTIDPYFDSRRAKKQQKARQELVERLKEKSEN